MKEDFERILDVCIDRINRGESIESCLKDYPEIANDLSPLLRSMFLTKNAFDFSPAADAKRQARQHLFTALEKQATTPAPWWLLRPALWVSLVSVIVIIVAGYFALRATVFPVQTPRVNITSPSPTGNFAFLVSDDVNALADFSDLFVTVDNISLLQTGNATKWVDFAPETSQFDLTLLPGDKTQQLWRGNVPEGNYSQVVISVSEVHGTLKATGETISIKLPSDKLKLSQGFTVSNDSVTSFVYDLTVIHTGNGKNGKYILKPQAASSGASQSPVQSLPAPGKSLSTPGKGNGRKDG